MATQKLDYIQNIKSEGGWHWFKRCSRGQYKVLWCSVMFDTVMFDNPVWAFTWIWLEIRCAPNAHCAQSTSGGGLKADWNWIIYKTLKAKGVDTDLSAVHVDTAKFCDVQWCSTIQFERSHESDLKSDAYQMRIAFNPPREVVWKRIETGLYYYPWFTRGYAYNEVFGLLVGLAFHGLW